MSSSNKYYYSLFLVFISLLISACSPDKPPALPHHLPETTRQALLVTTHSWTTSEGNLQRFEKKQGQWEAIGDTIPVMLGRNGTSWGTGLHSKKDRTHFKKEGDGKAPAGIFKLGTSFGYADTAPVSQHYPYRKAGKRDYYIDDVESKDYNQWVNIPNDKDNTPKTLWNSFEKMQRDDRLYEWGIEIEHNKNPIVKKAGSAIFMHIWKNSETPTAGCTAMEKANLIEILKWLDATKEPLLIQVPTGDLNHLYHNS